VSTIVIVGAGKGYGLSLAKVFGRHGYQVALIARSQAHLDDLVGQLAAKDIVAAGFVGDVLDASSLTAALQAASAHFGGIDVLEYSPIYNSTPPQSLIGVDKEALIDNFNGLVLGASAAVNAVVPQFIEKQQGAILFTTGLSAIYPIEHYGSYSISGAALVRLVQILNESLAKQGIYVGVIGLGTVLRPAVPEGHITHPDTIAAYVYELLQERKQPVNTYPKDVTPETILWNREFKED
jgi:NAD(P)-dependent dehydrogenase (short-subunit alcohol dehydrogenase family)